MADGHPILIPAAVDALKQCIFEDLSGKQVRYTLTIEFELVGVPDEPGKPAFDFVLPNYIRTAVRPPGLTVSTGLSERRR